MPGPRSVRRGGARLVPRAGPRCATSRSCSGAAGLSAGDEAFDAQLRWESGEEYPAHLAMQMWGEGERPDPERLEAALALARRIAAAAPRASAPGALATCGVARLGARPIDARGAVRALACEIEPEHGLAEIVRSFVHAGHLPDGRSGGRQANERDVDPAGSCRSADETPENTFYRTRHTARIYAPPQRGRQHQLLHGAQSAVPDLRICGSLQREQLGGVMRPLLGQTAALVELVAQHLGNAHERADEQTRLSSHVQSAEYSPSSFV